MLSILTIIGIGFIWTLLLGLIYTYLTSSYNKSVEVIVTYKNKNHAISIVRSSFIKKDSIYTYLEAGTFLNSRILSLEDIKKEEIEAIDVAP